MLALTRRGVRFVAGTVCFLFLLNSVTPAQAANAEEVSLTSAFPKEISPVLTSPPIEIPESLASIQETFVAPSSAHPSRPGKFVVYVQDIHTSVKVQREIAELIEVLSGRDGFKLVAYEGNQGPIETQKVFWFPDEKLRRAVSNRFLGSLRLSGAEYAHVNSKTPFTLWGVEDQALYRRNLKLFQNALRVRQDALNVLQEIEREITKHFTQTASSAGKKFFEIQTQYREGRLNLASCIKELAGILDQEQVGYSFLTHILFILDFEKKARTRHRLSQLKKIEEIKSKELFDELKELKALAMAQSLKSRTERNLYQALESVRILKNIANLTATRDELEAYWSHENQFAEDYFLRVIRSVPGERQWKPQYQNFLDDLIEVAAEFYSVSRERDEVIARNLVKALDQEKSAILVAGGFHTPGIARKLRQEGISYVIVSPKFEVREKQTERAYQEAIMGFHENSGKTVSLLADAVRQPTLRDIKAERIEANRTALELIRTGEVRSDPEPIRRDLAQLTTSFSKAASLGDMAPSFLSRSILIPPSRAEAGVDVGLSSHETTLCQIDPRGKFNFGPPDELDHATREALLDRGYAERDTVFWEAIDYFLEFYPGVLSGRKLSVVKHPSDFAGIKKDVIYVDSQFIHPAVATAGLVEVLYGSCLADDPARVQEAKLFTLIRAISYLARMDRGRNLLGKRLQDAGRYHLICLLETIWRDPASQWSQPPAASQAQPFNIDLLDEKSRERILNVMAETGEDGAQTAEELRRLEPWVLDERVQSMERNLTARGIEQRLGAARETLESIRTRIEQGKLDEPFLRSFSKHRIREALRLLAKERDFETLSHLICSAGMPDSFEESLVWLYAGLAPERHSGIHLSPEELAEAMFDFHRRNFRLDLEGVEKTIADFVATDFSLPNVEPRDIQETARLFKAKVEQIPSDADSAASSLGESPGSLVKMRESSLVPSLREMVLTQQEALSAQKPETEPTEEEKVEGEAVTELDRREVFRIDFKNYPRGRSRPGLLAQQDASLRQELYDETALNTFLDNMKFAKKIWDEDNPGLFKNVILSFVDKSDESDKRKRTPPVFLEIRTDRRIVRIDYAYYRQMAWPVLVGGIAEVLFMDYLQAVPNKAAVKLVAMMHGLDYLMNTNPSQHRWFLTMLFRSRRFKLLRLVGDYWNEAPGPDGKKAPFQNDVLDPERKEAFLAVLKEAWPAREEEISKLRSLTPRNLDQLLAVIIGNLQLRGFCEQLERIQAQDRLEPSILDGDFLNRYIQMPSDRYIVKRNILFFLIKAKKFDMLLHLIGVKDKNDRSGIDALADRMPDVIRTLYVGLLVEEDSGIRLTPQELAEALFYLHQNRLYLTLNTKPTTYLTIHTFVGSLAMMPPFLPRLTPKLMKEVETELGKMIKASGQSLGRFSSESIECRLIPPEPDKDISPLSPDEKNKVWEILSRELASFTAAFPGFLLGVDISSDADPEAYSIVLRGREIKINPSLLAQRPLWIVGMIEVLCEKYLKEMPNQAAVKLFSALEALKEAARADLQAQAWWIERLTRAEKFRTLAVLKKLWDSSRKTPGSEDGIGNLRDAVFQQDLVNVLAEIWPEGANQIRRIQETSQSRFAELLESIGVYVRLKALAEHVTLAAQQGKLNPAFIDKEILSRYAREEHEKAVLIRNLLIYLVKMRKFEILQHVIITLGRKKQEEAPREIVHKAVPPVTMPEGKSHRMSLWTSFRDKVDGWLWDIRRWWQGSWIREALFSDPLEEGLERMYAKFDREKRKRHPSFWDVPPVSEDGERTPSSDVTAELRKESFREYVLDLSRGLVFEEDSGLRLTVDELEDALVHLAGQDMDPALQEVARSKISADRGGATSARSLGEEPRESFALLSQSGLFPPREATEGTQVQEIFSIDAERRVRFAPGREVSVEKREYLLDRVEEVRGAVSEFSQEYPNLFEGLTLSFLENPSQAITLVGENGEKVLQIDQELLERTHEFLVAGIVEVLFTSYLKGPFNPAGVKLFSLIKALSILVNVPADQRPWFDERLQEAERYRLLAFLKGSQGKPFSEDLADENLRESYLGILDEMGPEGNELARRLRMLSADELARMMKSMDLELRKKGKLERVSIAQGVIEAIKSLMARGSFDNDFINRLPVRQKRDVIILLAKHKEWDVIAKWVRAEGGDQVMLGLLIDLLRGLGEENSAIGLSPQEVADVLVGLTLKKQLFDLGGLSRLVQHIGQEGLPGLPAGKLLEVATLFSRAIHASSLGQGERLLKTRYQELLVQVTGELNRDFLKKMIQAIENAGRKRGLTLLVESQLAIPELKEKMKALGLSSQNMGEIRFEVNKLLTQKDFRELSDYVEGLKTKLSISNPRRADWPDIALIADFDVLNQVRLEKVISLARDKAGLGKGLEPFNLSGNPSAEKEGTYAALFNLAWEILGGGPTAHFLDKVERDPQSGILLARLEVLKTLVQDWISKQQLQLSA